MTELKSVHQIYVTLWDIVQECGLAMSAICEGVKSMGSPPAVCKHNWLAITRIGRLCNDLIRCFIPPQPVVFEGSLGQLLWAYKYVMPDPMLETLELEPVQDPCEEAKLKVKKN
uniref:Saposin B-type domain-containing protein n=1 Tax=Globodera pallida TaxID=36090 RepID=A0A183BUA2_GLOPA